MNEVTKQFSLIISKLTNMTYAKMVAQWRMFCKLKLSGMLRLLFHSLVGLLKIRYNLISAMRSWIRANKAMAQQ